MSPERRMEIANESRKWEYSEIRDTCRRVLDEYMRPEQRTLKWDDAIYNFAQDILNKELSRNQIKEMFEQRVEEIMNPHADEEETAE